MNPNAKWDDDMLDQKFHFLDDRAQAVENTLTALAEVPLRVAKTELILDGFHQDMVQLGDNLRACRDDLAEWRKHHEETESRRASQRLAVVVAVIGASAVVLAALIAAFTGVH